MQNQPEMMAIASRLLPLTGAASTLIGGRSENQDNLGWVDTPLGFLLMVADGMGGGPGGKTASHLATLTFMQTLMQCPPDADRAAAMRKAVSCAEDALDAKMAETPALRGMGTTLVALLVSEESALIAHLGDSRCYRLRGSTVLFRTQDHSLVAELVHNKALTEEQARCSPQSNVITRGLGNTTNHVAEIDEVPYRAGDRFVLCTDGVWGIMRHSELVARMGARLSVAGVVNGLQAEVDRLGAAAGGSHDNHTLAIIEMASDSKLKDKMSKQIKILLATLTAVLLVSIISNVTLAIFLHRSPGKDALAQAESTVATLQQNAQTMERINDETVKSSTVEIERLKQDLSVSLADNTWWEEAYDELYGQNDSLQQALAKAQGEISRLSATIAASNPATETGSKPASKPYTIGLPKPTPVDLAKQISDGLAAMRDCKAPDRWETASSKQGASCWQLNKLLRELNHATSRRYDRDIGGIILGLKDKDITNIDNHKEKDGCYHPTKYALDKIKLVISHFEAIHRKINKDYKQ